MRSPHFFDTSTVWEFDGIFVFDVGSMYHAKTFMFWMNQPSINMVYNGIDPDYNSGIQRFLSP